MASVIAIALSLLLVVLPAWDSNGPGLNIQVQKIYDGDSYTVLFQPSAIQSEWIVKRVRLKDVDDDLDVNAPEIRGKERARGLLSKVWVQEQLAMGGGGRLITLGEHGKYGRLLGDLAYHCRPLLHPADWCRLSQEIIRAGQGERAEY